MGEGSLIYPDTPEEFSGREFPKKGGSVTNDDWDLLENMRIRTQEVAEEVDRTVTLLEGLWIARSMNEPGGLG